MDDPSRVRVRERGRDGRAESPRLLPAERATADDCVQAVSLDELEDEHRLPAILEDVVEPDDVRVLEPGKCRGLALEARAELLVVGDPGMQHLERHLAPEPLVVGAPDDAHATATELVAQAIAVRDDVLGVLHVTPPGVPGRRWTLVGSRSDSVNAGRRPP